jgi:hypothetical protein
MRSSSGPARTGAAASPPKAACIRTTRSKHQLRAACPLLFAPALFDRGGPIRRPLVAFVLRLRATFVIRVFVAKRLTLERESTETGLCDLRALRGIVK